MELFFSVIFSDGCSSVFRFFSFFYSLIVCLVPPEKPELATGRFLTGLILSYGDIIIPRYSSMPVVRVH